MLDISKKLEGIIGSMAWVAPELWLVLLLSSILVLDLILLKKENKTSLLYIAIAGLVVSLFFINQPAEGIPADLFLGMLAPSATATFFKNIFVLSGIATLLLTLMGKKAKSTPGEFFVILLAIILGLNLMVMASNLLMVYLAIELVSISSYTLTFFKFDKKSAEGSMKYLLFGAVSSAVMLYGISLLYGMNGSLSLNMDLSATNPMVSFVALALTFGGLLFKISAPPFHVWTPDVYESAPTPLAAFFSVAPKAAGIGVFINLTQSIANFSDQTALLSFLAIAAGLSMLIGNFSAIWQKNAKRMLAYSSIAHAGFLMLVLFSWQYSGKEAVLFYIGTYFLMNFAAFGLVHFVEEQKGSALFNAMNGLGMRLPFLGILMIIVMISLTGLPPTAGFTAKLFIFSGLWEAYSASGNQLLLTLFIFGLANTLVALFYYIRIPFVMFFKKEEGKTTFQPSIFEILFLAILSLSLLAIFFQPSWLLGLVG
ncbi:NADH-quinone oxidoreductase subunit N [Flammeovirgaceae bacterium SG7u.111]|nr:NADH-quinone oxidoreductase subunit N [Flammeovirgaceae bacterium SG7u.132]WPO38374.1 NADH-quinone oxidoreductase subunit N [Flammeovirgaceae bacterium SG7u.111]